MIDLHIHTTSSDGSEEPLEILIKAQSAGLKYISITDHDSIDAYKKLKKLNVNNYFAGNIITGCEFSAVHDGMPIEILGYGIDLETIAKAGVISDERFLDRENEYLEKLKGVCKTLGIKYSKNLSVGGRYFATQVMHSDITSHPENEKHFSKEVWEKINAFYRKCVTNPDSPFFLNQIKDYLTVQETADLIKKAGGKAFLAHLYGYIVDDYEGFIDSIESLNALDGIECYHSLHSMDKTNYLLDYCRKHKLYASGGSDYHGKLKPTVKLGECINGVKIPYEILEPWL